MKTADITPIWIKYWAQDAVGLNTVANIPLLPETSGRASFSLGFDVATFLKKSAGGDGPWGADFNGAYQSITITCQRFEAGVYPTWTSQFSEGIGGYVKNAGPILHKGMFWVSLSDQNTEEPRYGATNWITYGQWLLDQQRQGSGSDAFNIPLGGMIEFILPEKYIPKGFVVARGQIENITGIGLRRLPDTVGRMTKGIGDDSHVGLVSGNTNYDIQTQTATIADKTADTQLGPEHMFPHTHSLNTDTNGGKQAYCVGQLTHEHHDSWNYLPPLGVRGADGTSIAGGGNATNHDFNYPPGTKPFSIEGGNKDGSNSEGHNHVIPNAGNHDHELNIEPPNVQVYKIVRIY